MSDQPQGKDSRQLRHRRHLGREEIAAGFDLGRLRTVAGRRAPHRVGDAAIDQGEAVVGAFAISAAGESEAEQGSVEKLARVIASEGAARAIGAHASGSETHHQEVGIECAERWDGRVMPLGLFASVVVEIVRQARTQSASALGLYRRCRHRVRPAGATSAGPTMREAGAGLVACDGWGDVEE